MATKDITDVQVVQAVIDAKANGWPKTSREDDPGVWPYTLLMNRTGECFKVCFASMLRAEDRGYIECGVSLRTGWVTTEGYELLGFNRPKAGS